jgi:tetratricopeptide (TPR) repeat protein
MPDDDPAAAAPALDAAGRSCDEAATQAEALLRARPGALAQVMRQGWAARSAGRAAEARALWQAAARALPEAASPRLALARAARLDGRAAEAWALVEAVLGVHPAHAGARLEAAVQRREAGQPAAALALVEAVLADEPRHVAALLECATLRLEAQDEAGAEAALRAAVGVDPDHGWAQFRLGRLLRRRGALAEALGPLRAALAAAAPPAQAREALAGVHLDLGQAAAALAVLRAAPRPAADPGPTLLEAAALTALGRGAEAAALLRAAAPRHPRIAAAAAVAEAARDRPARLGSARPPGAAEAGWMLAEALDGADAGAIAEALDAAARDAHPFTAIGAARLLMARGGGAQHLAAGLAAAHAFGVIGMASSALATLDALEAGPTLAQEAAARQATRQGHARLGTGDRAGAAAAFDRALSAGGPAQPGVAALREVLDALPDGPAPQTCAAMLDRAGLPPALRAWLADRAAERIAADDPRLALAGLPPAERGITEALLRRNLALARGRRDEARDLLAGVFAPQGLDCPQPAGAPAGIAAFATPPAAPVEGPLVSVVVSAFEAEATLGMALGSVCAQSWRNLEVLVVDDASTDGTAAVIAAAAARDPRIRPLTGAANAGTYACRNRAIAAARGAFVTFHDADDWMHPRRIETEMAAFADPAVQAVNSRWFRMDGDGRVPFLPRGRPVFANPSFLLFRRGALDRLGAYDRVRVSGDTEMHWRARLVLGRAALALLPQVLTVGAARPGSLTTAAGTGMDLFGFNAARLAYHEAWGAWHAREDAAGRAPRVEPAGPPPAHLAGLPPQIAAAPV